MKYLNAIQCSQQTSLVSDRILIFANEKTDKKVGRSNLLNIAHIGRCGARIKNPGGVAPESMPLTTKLYCLPRTSIPYFIECFYFHFIFLKNIFH